MAKATQEIGEKYAAGKGGQDVSETGPTGTAYKAKNDAEIKEKRLAKIEKQKLEASTGVKEKELTEEDLDSENEEDDADHALRRIRDQRLKEIKRQQQKKLEDIGKGHGQYRQIVQDEFIKEMTSSDRVICHFYHRDFPKCEVMHHHLQKLAQRHIEAKFVQIDAEKAMFFVQKLSIRSIPTVVLFYDGIANDKIIGFEGLADDQPEGKVDEWPTIRLARLLASKGAINKANIVDDDEIEADAKAKMEHMRKNAFVMATGELSDDDLFDD